MRYIKSVFSLKKKKRKLKIKLPLTKPHPQADLLKQIPYTGEKMGGLKIDRETHRRGFC